LVPFEYQVRIPKGTKQKFAQKFDQMKGDWDGYVAYVMRHGERFEDVARTYGLSQKALKDLNGVSDISDVRGGTMIVVPKIDEERRKRNAKLAEDDLYHSDVAPGGAEDPMIVAVPDPALVIEGKKRVFYRVVAGDSLDQVAAALSVKRADLASWNALDGAAKLQPRMVLVAHVAPEWDATKANVALLDDSRLLLVEAGSKTHMDLVEGRKGRERVLVKAK